MRQEHFRHSVVQSSLTPLIVFVFFALICVLPNLHQQERWLSLLLFSAMAYVMIEWNNRFQLLRIRSRMNSVCFLTLVFTQPMLHQFSWSLLPAAALLLCYFFLFFVYAQHRAQGYLFHAFFLLSAGSLLYPALLLLVPFLLLGIHRDLNATSIKNIAAILLALLLPYWLAFPLCLLPQYSHFPMLWQQHWQESFHILRCTHLVEHFGQNVHYGVFVNKVFLFVLALIAVFHFTRTAYSDKLRTRQYYYLLCKAFLPVSVLFLLENQHRPTTTLIFIVTATPFIAHFFALARTMWVNVLFVVMGVFLFFLSLSNLFDLWDEYRLLFHYLLST